MKAVAPFTIHENHMDTRLSFFIWIKKRLSGFLLVMSVNRYHYWPITYNDGGRPSPAESSRSAAHAPNAGSSRPQSQFHTLTLMAYPDSEDLVRSPLLGTVTEICQHTTHSYTK